MDQEKFQQISAGSSSKYEPYTGTAPHYELVEAKCIEGGRAIYVIILDERGFPAIGVKDWHHFGDGADDERFTYMGVPIEHILGEGSKFFPPDEPPNRISVLDSESDFVFSGLPVGFHWTMTWTFQFKSGGSTPPPNPNPNPIPPGDETLFTAEQLLEIHRIAREEIAAARITPQ